MKNRVCRLHGMHDLRVEELPVSRSIGTDEVLIRLAAGGICGSDLHYYHDGGFGPIRVREPIIVGHEAAGLVYQTGAEVKDLSAGDLVAVNPSQSCKKCIFCMRQEWMHCLNMEFFGSAYHLPHTQGLFREWIVVPRRQLYKFNQLKDAHMAACSEPLAVSLHASRRAPELEGKRVLVTGVGPIGALCVAVARAENADCVVATDILDMPLAVAEKMGATETINIATHTRALDQYKHNKGQFDIVFECSAASSALRIACEVTRPLGTIIQVGVTGDISVPLNLIVSKELHISGTHRFHHEFAEAVQAIDSGIIDVAPIVSQVFPIDRVAEAFDSASDRSTAVKVQISL